MEYMITKEQTEAFREYLRREERAEKTIDKYMHDLCVFRDWAGSRCINRELVSEWKEKLSKAGFAAVTVNAALAALHSFFAFNGWYECRVKYLKIQRRVFREESRELTKYEYEKLIHCAAQKGDDRLVLLMETICATGIRVSEVNYITVEAAKRGFAEVQLKGKIRTILLPGKLVKKLLKYARKQKITCGEIFLSASGRSLSRKQIWSDMKKICKDAGVEESKVFPHNLRHLFARTFYKVCSDIVRLADVLGHSSIETTRIYLITTGWEHARQLDRLGLIS